MVFVYSIRMQFLDRRNEPVSIASTAFLRIVFGAILTWQLLRFITKGLVQSYFVDPVMHYTYLGLDWVQPLPGLWMHVEFWVLTLCAVCVTLGLFYRVSIIALLIGWTHIWLIDQRSCD